MDPDWAHGAGSRRFGRGPSPIAHHPLHPPGGLCICAVIGPAPCLAPAPQDFWSPHSKLERKRLDRAESENLVRRLDGGCLRSLRRVAGAADRPDRPGGGIVSCSLVRVDPSCTTSAVTRQNSFDRLISFDPVGKLNIISSFSSMKDFVICDRLPLCVGVRCNGYLPWSVIK